MTDVHSHILFNVDDGSSNIEESIELLKELKRVGFNNVILTPHYIDSSEYSCDNSVKLERFELLKEAVKDIGINIYLGNEIFIDENIISFIKNREVFTLNNTRCILIELPFHNKIINLEDILYELKHVGLLPVIAHPERYSYFQENYELVENLRNEGIMFQGNYASILGYYGRSSEKLLKTMLKDGYIDFLGTDLHHTKKKFVIDNFSKIEKTIKKITGEEGYKKIISNGNKLVGD